MLCVNIFTVAGMMTTVKAAAQAAFQVLYRLVTSVMPTLDTRWHPHSMSAGQTATFRFGSGSFSLAPAGPDRGAVTTKEMSGARGVQN